MIVWKEKTKKPLMPADSCRLLAGRSGRTAQLTLALAVLAVLVAKRAREHPRRPLGTWAADVGKQALGQAAAHGSGLLVSLLAAAAGARGGGGSAGTTAASECGWYAVAFALDTALGTYLAIALHRACVRAARRAVAGSGAPPPPPLAPAPSAPLPVSFAEAVSRCGDYGKPPSASLFIPQAVEWVGCVLAARAACGCLVALAHAPLARAAAGVDGAFSSAGPGVELAAVMVMGPLALNALQALLQDAVLARRRRVGFAHPPVSPRGSLTGGGGGAGTPLASFSPAPSGDMEALLTPLPPDRARA